MALQINWYLARRTVKEHLSKAQMEKAEAADDLYQWVLDKEKEDEWDEECTLEQPA